jgi:predicted RecA/RadA family phage recombinase
VVAAANTNSGDVVILGGGAGIALATTPSGANVPLALGATAQIRKLNGASTAFAAGANVHWDATNANATPSATSNVRIGVAERAAANADTVVVVHFHMAH